MNELLQQLKGARLSAFMALALNEPELWLGRGKPLSARDIAARTRLSPRHVLRAVQYLVEQDLVSLAPERGGHREKLFRVSERVRSGRATATVAAPQCTVRADPDKLSEAKTKTVPIHRKKSKASPDTQARVSERTPSRAAELPTATVAAPHHTPRAGYDNVSRSETRNAPIHRMKSKANPDTQARVSERTRTRVSESPPATVAAPHHTPRAGYDNLSGSEIKIAPIHRMKSKIDGDKSSRSARALTRTRTRARARVVVVPFRNNINKSVPASRIKQQQQPEHFRASRAIFADAHVEGRSLVQLARTVEADLARQWTDRLADAPASFTDPVGYMIRHLLDDPTEAPPYAWQRPKKPSLFDADFARFVHGRPEHTQYCREHPELVDCECGV